MKVFISWSGPLSHQVALILREWLPDVLQAIEPYVSSEDLRKGNRWAIDVANELEGSEHGILCLTKENLQAPWILFEAGALSKSVGSSSLWTILVDVTNAEIEGPLAQFHHTVLSHDDFKRLIETINSQLGTAQLAEARLERVFETFWPDLESRVSKAIQTASQPDVVRPSRSEKAMIEEILDISRTMSKVIAEFKAIDADCDRIRTEQLAYYYYTRARPRRESDHRVSRAVQIRFGASKIRPRCHRWRRDPDFRRRNGVPGRMDPIISASFKNASAWSRQ